MKIEKIYLASLASFLRESRFGLKYLSSYKVKVIDIYGIYARISDCK